jgi:glutathione S-transferase
MAMPAPRPDLCLVTIPFSHFCEKARWALDRAGLHYREDGYLPMLSWLPALRAGGRRQVPVLRAPGGAVSDSTDILRWVDRQPGVTPLFPAGDDEVAGLEESFDRSLGPHARRLGYSALLPQRPAVAALLDGAPRWQARLARPALPLITRLIRRGLRVEPVAVERSRQRIDEIFAEIGARLADGRRYLTGDRFTAADLTFAALAAPLVAPPGYDRYLPPAETWSDAMREMIDARRATPAGAFVLRMYRDERGRAAN